MVAPGKPCPKCKTPLQATRLAPFGGAEGPLRISVDGMPVLACDKPHRYFVKPDFPLWLMGHLVNEDEATLPAGDPTGLLFKTFLCHDCHQPLAPKPDHVHSFKVDVAYPGEAPFTVDIAMPVFKCPGCGKEQLHSLAELRKLTPAALAHGFKDAGIIPPG